MRMQRVWSVAAFEWHGVVCQFSYWFTFFLPLLPLFVVAAMRSLSTQPAASSIAELVLTKPAAGRVVFAGLFLMPFVLALLSNLNGLLLATVEERENRVGEVLLASIGADELTAGKLLGIGAAVLLQMGTWMSLLVAALVFDPLIRPALPDVRVLVAAGALLLLGQIFMSSVFLAGACLGGSARASQQIVGNCVVLTILPVGFALRFVAVEPHGVVAHALTWFPPSAPLVASLRLLIASDGISWVEISGVFVLLVALTAWTVRTGARLYRMSLVSAGASMGWRAILRQARLAR
jgi:ABC-2 type transport system permease protein